MKYACGHCERQFDESELVQSPGGGAMLCRQCAASQGTCARCGGTFKPEYMLKDTSGYLVCRVCASGRRQQQVQTPPAVSPGFWKPLAIAAGLAAVIGVTFAAFRNPAAGDKKARGEAVSVPVPTPTNADLEAKVAILEGELRTAKQTIVKLNDELKVRDVDPQQAAELEKVKQERDNWKSLAGLFAKAFEQMKKERDQQVEDALRASLPPAVTPKQPDLHDKIQKDYEARMAEIERAYKARLAEIEAARKRIPAPESPAVGAGDSAIESRIDGDFNGWEGETIFKLQNGASGDITLSERRGRRGT